MKKPGITREKQIRARVMGMLEHGVGYPKAMKWFYKAAYLEGFKACARIK